MVLENARIWGENPARLRGLDPPAGRRLQELRAPLLVVVGETDAPGIHQLADTLVARTPGARRQVVAGAGHMVSVERPADLAGLIETFQPAEPRP